MANSTTTTMVDVFLNSKVHEFLRGRQVYEKGHEFSLTAMGEHKGKWFVSDADYPQFLDILHDHLVTRRLRPMNLVEQRKPDGITPLTIDLDFRYPGEKALTRAFTQEMIHAFVLEILNVLKTHFELKGRIRFFVTLRPQPYVDRKTATHKKEIKDGIHILCPDFTLNAELQAFVRHKILEADSVKKSFKETGYINKDDNVFDKMMVGPKANGWMFYGESKPEIPPYELKHIFKYAPTSGRFTMESIENYTPRDILQTLSIRYNLAPQLIVLQALKESIYKQIAEWAKPKAPEASPENELIEVNPGLWEPYMHDIKPESELDLIRSLTKECLSSERADEYDTWIKVGWCLRNIDTSDEMFNAWMDFSRKSSKFSSNNVDQLRKQWANGSMRRDNYSSKLTAGSLHFWARQDNPGVYKKIMGDNIINYIRKVGSTFKGGTHHHVASIMKKLFHERYICSVDNRSTEWFEFREHVWVHIPQGMKLKEHIHNDVATLVSDARAAVRSMSATCKAEDEDKLTKDLAKLLDFEKNLYSANFKDSIMKECVQLFYNEQFIKLLNQDPYLLGCANGVLHLRHILTDDKGKLVRYQPTLMAGRPTDYVSLQLGMTPDGQEPIEYVPYNAADPVQGEIMEFFKQLFPADDLREYVLTIAAGCLEGANKEQCFYIMTGCGGNGKSKFTELMSSVFGQYAGSLSTTALTRKRPESGAANPDIMGIKACRFIDMKEPDENEPINSARMKQFSGEDLVEARGLFKDQERFKIMGKIFMACNRMPPIHSMDGGTWRRIRVIPFDSRFVIPSQTPVDIANHIYPRDDMMDENLKKWRIPFFSLLVHYYETRYCPNGVKKVPDIVMQASNNYKNSHDSFGKFLGARVRRVPGYDEPPMFPKLWSVYRNWQLEENSSGKKLTQNEFRIRLNEAFQAPSDGKTYKHIRIFASDEDAEEYDKEAQGEADIDAQGDADAET